jgi:hypothetical protein
VTVRVGSWAVGELVAVSSSSVGCAEDAEVGMRLGSIVVGAIVGPGVGALVAMDVGSEVGALLSMGDGPRLGLVLVGALESYSTWSAGSGHRCRSRHNPLYLYVIFAHFKAILGPSQRTSPSRILPNISELFPRSTTTVTKSFFSWV